MQKFQHLQGNDLVEALSWIFAINIIAGIVFIGYFAWKKSQREAELEKSKAAALAAPPANTQAPVTTLKRVLVIEGTVAAKGSVQWLKSWGIAVERIADVVKIDGPTKKELLPLKTRECFEELYALGSVRGTDVTRLAQGDEIEKGKSLYFVLLEPTPKDLQLIALVA